MGIGGILLNSKASDGFGRNLELFFDLSWPITREKFFR
jgi:hypothetical protein